MNDSKTTPNLASNVNPVSITNETIKTDKRLNEMLREIGQRMGSDDITYMGSFATHIYVTTDQLGTVRRIETAHQQVGATQGHSIYEMLSEQAIMLAMTTQKDQMLMDMHGKKPKTRNIEDTRKTT